MKAGRSASIVLLAFEDKWKFAHPLAHLCAAASFCEVAWKKENQQK